MWTPVIKPVDIKRVIVEFTTRCNLRCAYCAKSLAGADVSTDIPDELLNRIIDFIISNKTGQVCVNGHGETTCRKDWQTFCERMLDQKVKVGIISNFAKKFSAEEIHTLSRFANIEVSCDTADPHLFSRLRGGSDLNELLGKMQLVRAEAQKENRKPPSFTWSCVLSDQNVFGLEEYVKLGIQYGVEIFNFCNLVSFPDSPDFLPVKHITELPDDKFCEALLIFRAVTAVLQKMGKGVCCPGGLIEKLVNRLKSVNSQNTLQNTSSSSAPLHTGETRNCTDPWNMIYFHADGRVSPCCTYTPFGDLSRSGIEEIINCEEMLNIRRGLLSGELHGDCINCQIAEWKKTGA